MAVNLHTNHFRFGVDELAENTHGWYAAEDVSPAQGVIPSNAVFLLRFNVQETGGTAAGNTDNQFEFQINGGGWASLTTTSVGPRAVAAAAFANAASCTKRLSGTGTFETSAAGCTEDGLSGGASNDIAASGCSETECGIIIDSADVSGGDTIEFRITSPDWSVTNDVVPTVIVAVSAVSVTPGTASLATARFAPTATVTNNVTVTPGTASLVTARFAPTVTATDNKTITPGTVSLVTSSFSPAATVGVRVIPGVAGLSLSTLAPTVTLSANVIVTPGAASLVMAGFAPTVAIITYTARGGIKAYSAASWANYDLYYEVTMRATAGTVWSRLRNVTTGGSANGCHLSTSNATMTRLRSSALTLVDGHEYQAETGKDDSSSGEILGASIVGIPN